MITNSESLRSKRQREFAELFLKLRKNGILNLCPRFGKCRVGINIFSSVKEARILIAYPDKKIKQAWEEEFEKMGYENPDIVFSTHRSLHKVADEFFDLVVIDEIHLLSKNQINELKKIRRRNIRILGLTGTISSFTRKTLKTAIGIDVIAEYSIEKAIEEGVITDYEIRVVTTPLENGMEKGQFNRWSTLIFKNSQKPTESRVDDTLWRLSRMRIIQKSNAKRKLTQKLLQEYSSERILVFCGITEIADNLGIPSHHSKVKDKTLFDAFAQGKGNHMAVVKIGNTGVTYKPLNKVIVNYFDSNPENMAQKIMRCMAMEYSNMEKKAVIYIISTDEEVELAWLNKALEFFEKDKIKYLKV